MAKDQRENPRRLDIASWFVVRLADQGPEVYRRALRQAEAANQLEPGNGYRLNTLGVAQYRVGQYEQAVKTLTRSDEINSEDLGVSHPADIAFLATAHHRLGHTEEAQKLLERLRQLLQDPRWKSDQESQAFLSQAETLLSQQKQE